MSPATWNRSALEELRALEPLLERRTRDLALIGQTDKADEWGARMRAVRRLIALASPPPDRPEAA